MKYSNPFNHFPPIISIKRTSVFAKVKTIKFYYLFSEFFLSKFLNLVHRGVLQLKGKLTVYLMLQIIS